MSKHLVVSLVLGGALFVPALALSADASNASGSSTKQSATDSPAKSQPQSASQSESTAADQSKTAGGEKQPSDVQLIEVEKQMLVKINAQRAKYGLPALVADKSLEQTARAHATWMTNNRSLQHTSRPVGENIAMGQRTTDEAVTDWMNSSGHRANILSPGYKRTGVAAYTTPDGTIYWCQQFLP